MDIAWWLGLASGIRLIYTVEYVSLGSLMATRIITFVDALGSNPCCITFLGNLSSISRKKVNIARALNGRSTVGKGLLDNSLAGSPSQLKLLKLSGGERKMTVYR